MSIGFVVVFRTNAKLDDVARYVHKRCGINLKKHGKYFEAYVSGVDVFISKSDNSISLFTTSYAGLHFSSQTWPTTQNFATYSIAEFVCAKFECNAQIVTDQEELICEVHFNNTKKADAANGKARSEGYLCTFKEVPRRENLVT